MTTNQDNKSTPIPSSPAALEGLITPLRLQAYFDDELDGDTRAEVEALLEGEHASMIESRLTALDALGDLVRDEHGRHIEDVNLDGLWGRIDASLEPATPSARPVPASPPGLLDRLRDFFEEQRRVLVPTFALAAIALLVLIPMIGNDAPKMPGEASPPPIQEAAVPAPESTDPPPPLETAPTPENIANREGGQPPIFVVVNPPSRNDDWFVGFSKQSPYPVIWLIGDKNSGQGPERVDPNTPLWPVVQEALRSLPGRLKENSGGEGLVAPPIEGTTPGGDPDEGPI